MDFKKSISSLLYNAGMDYDTDKFLMNIAMYGLGFGVALFLVFYNASMAVGLIAAALGMAAFWMLVYALLVMSAGRRIDLMEQSLPDFLILMAGNIRAGFTPDRALFASMNKEFGPLTQEIEKAAKTAMTGKAFHEAFQLIGARLNSTLIKRSVTFVVEGIKSGGSLTRLLEDTSNDIRKFEQIKKEINANVNVYRVFLFVACAIGAPLLYATANFLIEIVFGIRSSIEFDVTEAAALGMPVLKGSAIAPELVFWFSVTAITLTSLFSSMAVGIISTGREGEGLRYFPILFAISMAVFLGTGLGLKLLYSFLFNI